MAYLGKNPYTDAYTKAETDAKIVELSPPTKLSNGKSSMLSGSASVSNTTLMAGFGTKLYTGNGSTQSIDAGIDLATQWGDSANETYGGLMWGKTRSAASNHWLIDSIRGNSEYLQTNTTAIPASTGDFGGFTSTGFSLNTAFNASGYTYASWIFQTTHRISGTTNHGKAYTCHYNPTTGFTIVKYEGSGIAGHEIPHHLGRELGIWHTKNLSTSSNWWSDISGVTGTNGDAMYLNLTNAKGNDYTTTNGNTVTNVVVGTSGMTNTSGSTYILYGWANSYYDDAGELNGNYEVGIYQGTGASGNKITTRGKPAWVMIKRLDTTYAWYMFDNQRDTTNPNQAFLSPTVSDAEQVYLTYGFNLLEDGFTCNDSNPANNASGGQYLYMVAYDNDNASGLSKYPKASETSNIQLSNLVVSFTNGVDANGVVNTIKNLGNFTVAPTGGWDL